MKEDEELKKFIEEKKDELKREDDEKGKVDTDWLKENADLLLTFI